jgi:hypothetical protein
VKVGAGVDVVVDNDVVDIAVDIAVDIVVVAVVVVVVAAGAVTECWGDEALGIVSRVIVDGVFASADGVAGGWMTSLLLVHMQSHLGE